MVTSPSTLQRLRNEIASLEKKRSEERKTLARLEKDIASLLNALARGTNSSAKSSQLVSKREKQAQAEGKIANLSKQISTKTSSLERALAGNATETEREGKKQKEQEKRRRQIELKHVQNITREMERQSRLSTNMQRYSIFNQEPLPSHITVLYLAANPVDYPLLALDEEARLIEETIRKGEYRDAIHLKTRWAVRLEDIFPALNEVQPDIIHISGHGAADAIYFQTPDKSTAPISIDAFIQLVQATSIKPKMIIFNTCGSEQFAQAILSHVPIAIGMPAEIADRTARIFVGQFYSALAFGKSIQEAFDQAKIAMRLAELDMDQSPLLFVREDLDAKEIILVQPY